MNLKIHGDMRWNSYYDALVSFIHKFFFSLSLFSFSFFFFLIICVVEVIVEDDLYFEQKTKTNILINLLKTFEFASDLHLIKSILKIVYELS
jgi:uncharacterized protein YqgC (DUF456 family)